MNPPQEIVHARLDLGAHRESTEAFLAAFDAARVPTAPGCYLMLDSKGRVIYVGKAKHLRNRIRTYLNESDSRYSVKFLMRRVAQIDFLVTSSDKEAVLLENSLIKQHKPRYNVQLKDDKTFLSIRFDLRQDFPRLTTVRRYKRDGAKYFGPYHSSSAVWQALRQIQRLFPLRTCSDHVLHNRTRPCLYYQMKRCAGPCVNLISREAYHELADQVVMVLEGRSGELDEDLTRRIKTFADHLEFEQAAAMRDRLFALRKMMDRQRAVNVPGAEDRDVFGLYNEAAFTEIQVLYYRGGRMLGGDAWSFKRREMPVDELFSSFLLQFYAEGRAIPREIVIPVPLEDEDTLAELLTENLGQRVVLLYPQRGDKRAMVELANANAQQSFQQKNLREQASQHTLEDLQKALGLPRLPARIECFDISTLQGDKTVASMVVFQDGQADKSRYRRFSIKHVEGQDDFASMREVLLRRYTRAIEESDLPDLVLIDGGKGQLGVATAVLRDLGIEDQPHASIAKARTLEAGRSPERFFVPGRANPILLPQNGSVVLLLSQIRDEAHRFAITYHRKRRDKGTLRTALTGIPGVGPARAKTLLTQLGSVARIREASVEAIAALPGFNLALAQQVVDHFRSPA